MTRELDTVSQKASDPANKSLQDAFNWPDNPVVQKLLDVVAAIVAEEYIQTVRKNPEVFREIPASVGMTKGADK